MKQKIESIKYSGIYLLILMSLILLLSSIFFYIHIEINKVTFLISAIVSFIILRIIFGKKIIKGVVISFVILLISITSMTFIYDRSSDGNTYHKDAVGNLYNGWNPVYESSKEFLKDKQIKNYNVDSYNIWKDHYAKANWIMEASISKLANNIESGKAVNLIFMYILFSLSLSYFYTRLGNKSLALATIITFNPICCNQLFTFYNDQLGVSLLFILILFLLKVIDKKDEEKVPIKFMLLFSVFPIIINIKFNIMGYAMIYTFVFMIWYLIKKHKEHKLLSSIKVLIPSFSLLFIVSFIVIGYPTYIKNYIDHKNPFFPVYGEHSEDIITAQQPVDFVKKNSIEKFFIGTFSKTNNLQQTKEYKLKIPFTVSKEELKESMAIDTRIGGYGVISSGIFLISLFTIIIYFVKKKTTDEKKSIIIIVGITGLLILVISESWWARYNPNTYLTAIIMTYIILKYAKRKYLKYIISLIILLNSSIILFGNTYYSFKQSLIINKDLNKLKNKTVNISFNQGNMTGILYNLDDKNIKYNLVKKKTLKNNTYYKYLNYEEVTNEK